ncbi:MAG: peptidoglycan bridge formation glycyltransferase FemA/FemB family protein [Anaerolineaceae bacterium]|jgi:lipid II:glycine glycyltransferase (peptidoglycan interpeptide bridge formation enzyme)|nr:peptidoglycan bridge formation glycyltransferase FemA/FemB family protein [Anaerolineaceae bacterium]MDD4042723.1 peptidoglycan bridge formation glycyltransferase FemA/FemB family protein [Anaerolineaceae bacterium]MDD4577068.1 peptidoglycan bridge formation glycyltransferase FemA/FemB family protein [Anaerolineaceae bacterium]
MTVDLNRANTFDLPQVYPDAHLLQLPEWAEFKSHFGWQSQVFNSQTAAAQVLFRTLPLGYSIAYLTKGPLGSNWSSLWSQIDMECRKRKAVFLQIEPDVNLPLPAESEAYFAEGFIREEHTIQPRRTVLVSLEADEDELLLAMKQKTRYNIRLAAKKGVEVRPTDDVIGFYEMMQTTGNRDNFAVHSLNYYQNAYDIFASSGKCVLLAAYFEETPLAYLMLFLTGSRSWYFYGASDNNQRNLMPTYLLQWEAMRWAKARGATEYDLWGIPDADEDELEANFTERSDGLWGVYRFKRGFGGQVVRSSPAFIKIYKPLLYRLYQKFRASRVTE